VEVCLEGAGQLEETVDALVAGLRRVEVQFAGFAAGHGVHGGVYDGNRVGHRVTAGQFAGAGMDLHNICTKTAQ